LRRPRRRLRLGARLGRVVGGDRHQPWPAQPVRESSTTIASGVDAALDQRVARLLGRAHRAGDPPERWIERTSSPALEQRLVDREEVADRRLRGARQVASPR
jgi:hypothetical protein